MLLNCLLFYISVFKLYIKLKSYLTEISDRTVFTSSELLSSPRASSPASSILQANKREYYDPESHVEHLNSKLNAINREIRFKQVI